MNYSTHGYRTAVHYTNGWLDLYVTEGKGCPLGNGTNGGDSPVMFNLHNHMGELLSVHVQLSCCHVERARCELKR